jgi:hypothetical protein
VAGRSNEIRGVKLHEVKLLFVHVGVTMAGLGITFIVQAIYHHWVGLVAMAVVLQLWALAWNTRRCWNRWTAKPDYVTLRGVAVWDNGCNVPRTLVENAIERFVTVIVHETKGDVSEEDIFSMLHETGIEWESGHVRIVTRHHEMYDKYGIQHGYRLILRWPGSIEKSALFHELLHEVNETILLPRITSIRDQIAFRALDCAHYDAHWWGLEEVMNSHGR